MTELEYVLANFGIHTDQINAVTVSIKNPACCVGSCVPSQIHIDGVVSYRQNKHTYEKSELVAKKVILHDPATIVYWSDNTKTVVKSGKGDVYNPTTGVALCYMKKALGNKSRTFNDALRKAGV